MKVNSREYGPAITLGAEVITLKRLYDAATLAEAQAIVAAEDMHRLVLAIIQARAQAAREERWRTVLDALKNARMLLSAITKLSTQDEFEQWKSIVRPVFDQLSATQMETMREVADLEQEQ